MSVSAGKHNAKHNFDAEYRATLDNVDPSLTALNESLKAETIRDAYARLFGAALEKYNAKQVEKGHPERQINDYLKKVEDTYQADQAKIKNGEKWRKNVPAPYLEYVLQIGSHETWESEITREQAIKILTETYDKLVEETRGAIDWPQAVIHVDETDGTPHMHVTGIPYGESPRRGLETQVSMTKALKKLGLPRLPDLQNLMMKTLQEVAAEHGVERNYKNCDRKHVDVAEYKQLQRDTAEIIKVKEERTEQVEQLTAQYVDLIQQAAQVERNVRAGTKELKSLEDEKAKAIDQLKAEQAKIEAEIATAQAEAKTRLESVQEETRALEEECGNLEVEIELCDDAADELEAQNSCDEIEVVGLGERIQRFEQAFKLVVARAGAWLAAKIEPIAVRLGLVDSEGVRNMRAMALAAPTKPQTVAIVRQEPPKPARPMSFEERNRAASKAFNEQRAAGKTQAQPARLQDWLNAHPRR